MLTPDGESIRCALTATFENILASRMRELPIINPLLSVQTSALQRYGNEWLGILITPWSMNLTMLPISCDDWDYVPGAAFERRFPYGNYRFLVSHADGVGPYALCSLFSPMFEFADQAAAQATAESALLALLAGPKPPSLSRRDWLRGAWSENAAS
ncbi:[NiFe]-hydrogenase assembly chaperone HybE [Methylomonas sp. MED-D]|uniref:Rubredoxin n=1 Tax=Methylomonas koyamae TaxID=702114 RepID=A0A177NSG6_9GAMM|nr:MULTISPECIES: [NiFe]-hydrogenase assembly chaperone HybE [Methylomonas]MDT4328336.1 [NiFe]-hydrogenase assembly chaperone HybE [Methylomonas sp. MV1]NJA06342.1 [NiFe]-hydrogenase assembly chaperone HybE [Methylococcaceae bacterium WWC4]OAI19990.1 rubredoxin [Methylomonas koyamae]